MRATTQVWKGVFSASPGPPSPTDEWVDANILEEKTDAIWISARAGCLWVPRAYVRIKIAHPCSFCGAEIPYANRREEGPVSCNDADCRTARHETRMCAQIANLPGPASANTPAWNEHNKRREEALARIKERISNGESGRREEG